MPSTTYKTRCHYKMWWMLLMKILKSEFLKDNEVKNKVKILPEK